jgi:hypothetical protein
VRTVEWTRDAGRPGEVVVVAGPGAGEGFAAFRAQVGGERAPEPLDLAFADLTPEALVRVGADWWVLSDDGNRDLGGRPCKDAPRADRRARTARLPLP